MRREFLFATVLVAAFAVSASAQSGTGQVGTAGQAGAMQQAEPSQSAEKLAKDITLTGCLQSAPSQPGASAMGTAGTTGANPSASNAKFELANVTGAPATVSADHLALSGHEKDLEKHVGHKVEITGKLDASPSSAGTAGTSGSASPTLKVSSVKMLAESCSGQ